MSFIHHQKTVSFSIFIYFLAPVFCGYQTYSDSPIPFHSCGTIKFSAPTQSFINQTVVLLDGKEVITHNQFIQLQAGKLKDADFIPTVSEDVECAIQVCGSSFGKTKSFSGYADCQLYQTETKGPSYIYNERFALSSIQCGCMKAAEAPAYTCQDRELELKANWNKTDCAILFQEKRCNNFYLSPITLSKWQNFSTNYYHHINSMVVRENCTVSQTIPAFKKMPIFKDLPQPFLYKSPATDSTVKSAYQIDADYFICSCDNEPVPPPQPRPEPPSNTFTIGKISLIIGGICIAITLVVAWKIRRNSNTNFDVCFSLRNLSSNSISENYSQEDGEEHIPENNIENLGGSMVSISECPLVANTSAS